MNKQDPDAVIPLTPAEYQIIVALGERPLYGFALIEQCQIDSEQLISMRPGTLYPALKRLERFRVIEAVGEDAPAGSAHPRRIYGLTATGRLILEQETARLRWTVHLAEHRLHRLDKIQP